MGLVAIDKECKYGLRNQLWISAIDFSDDIWRTDLKLLSIILTFVRFGILRSHPLIYVYNVNVRVGEVTLKM